MNGVFRFIFSVLNDDSLAPGAGRTIHFDGYPDPRKGLKRFNITTGLSVLDLLSTIILYHSEDACTSLRFLFYKFVL